MLFLIVGTLSFAVADDDSEEFNLPEAKKIGFFENMFDNMGYAFIFNKEKKIQRALELAEKRLAEAEILAEENPERLERTQERYSDFIEKAKEALEKISDAKAENEDISIENMEKIARIQNQFERHREHIDMIYNRALERFDANNASEEKLARFDMFRKRALNHSNEMEAKIIAKRETAIKRHKVLAEKSDEELEDMVKDIEKREGLTAAREKRIERAEAWIQEIVAIKQRNIDRIQAHLDEEDLTNEQKEQIANKIRTETQKIQEFEVQAQNKITETRQRLESLSVKAVENTMGTNSLKNTVAQVLE